MKTKGKTDQGDNELPPVSAEITYCHGSGQHEALPTITALMKLKCVFKKLGFQYREDGMKLEME